MNRLRIALAATFACLLFAVPAGAQANLGGAPGSCDKACLRSMADAYFAALVAHDPSKAAIAPNAKFTENAQTVNVGDGLWKTASEGPTNYKVYVPDPVSEQIGAIVIMKESGKALEEKVFKIYNADGQLIDRNMTNQRPFDFESVHIFKIQKAQIHDIEAMGISLPLHSKNGWSDFWR